jgi:putative transposase
MARSVIPGVPHHITQRGNRREDVFFTDEDRRRYLKLLKEYSDKHGLEIQAYCLMRNHLHLVAVPRSEDALAAVFRPVDARYAQHVNWAHGLGGRLWQGRFFSCPLDEPHWLAAIRYVECNPVRARLVKRAEAYSWSSAAVHAGLRADPLVSDSVVESTGIKDWAAWLREDADDETVERLRRHTRTGRPLGSQPFVLRLERICGRTLRPKKAGRPRKPGT